MATHSGRSRATIRRLLASAPRAVSARGSSASWLSTASATACAIAASGVSRITCESGPCSACDSRSEATNAGVAPASAITSTSEGPAGMSMAAPSRRWLTCRLASVTKALPGRKIFATRGTLSVPNAVAAIACAPRPETLPARRTAAPHTGSHRRSAAASTALPGGSRRCAGVASISTVENSGADPPGIYRPTESIGRVTCWQRTPGCVSTSTGGSRCALWKVSRWRRPPPSPV